MCADEGHKFERVLNWPEIEFNQQALATCDRLVAANFPFLANEHKLATSTLVAHQDAGLGAIPEPRILWPFATNPNAHEPPRNCYSDAVVQGLEHGTRNAYWIAFTGSKKGDSKFDL